MLFSLEEEWVSGEGGNCSFEAGMFSHGGRNNLSVIVPPFSRYTSISIMLCRHIVGKNIFATHPL